MADHYYRLGYRERSKRRRRVIWTIVALIVILLLVWLGIFIKNKLKPKVVITQSRATTRHVDYDKKTKLYTQTDFTIELPATWKMLPRPAGHYQSFTWSNGSVGSDEERIEIFEDTIPVNFAVNRALIVEGQVDHLQVSGSVSDNCVTFTSGLGGSSQTGTPAKWQDINFLCDRFNTARDVIGTSSTDGINTVILKNQSTGTNHKFFFTHTDHSLNPDYTTFYNALQSLKMQ
jgi:hypothetical protein